MMVEKATDKEKGRERVRDKGHYSKGINTTAVNNNITTTSSSSSNATNTIIHRDIYKREQRLRYWINRVKHDSIPEEDKQDILKFIEYQEQEAAV
jgi:hypothetical protein